MIRLIERFQGSCNSIRFLRINLRCMREKIVDFIRLCISQYRIDFNRVSFIFFFVNSRRKFIFRIFFGLRFPSSDLYPDAQN